MAQNDTALASCWLADQEFGPRVQVRCREFDFTVTFEQSILSILPSALFIVLASIRIYVLIQKSPKVHGRYWQISKVVRIIPVHGCASS